MRPGCKYRVVEALRNGGFLKWWYPTTMGFPTKDDHFGVFWGTTIYGNIQMAQMAYKWGLLTTY